MRSNAARAVSFRTECTCSCLNWQAPPTSDLVFRTTELLHPVGAQMTGALAAFHYEVFGKVSRSDWAPGFQGGRHQRPALHLTTCLQVQKVYFRQHTLEEAQRLGLVGWVANTGQSGWT